MCHPRCPTSNTGMQPGQRDHERSRISPAIALRTSCSTCESAPCVLTRVPRKRPPTQGERLPRNRYRLSHSSTDSTLPGSKATRQTGRFACFEPEGCQATRPQGGDGQQRQRSRRWQQSATRCQRDFLEGQEGGGTGTGWPRQDATVRTAGVLSLRQREHRTARRRGRLRRLHAVTLHQPSGRAHTQHERRPLTSRTLPSPRTLLSTHATYPGWNSLRFCSRLHRSGALVKQSSGSTLRIMAAQPLDGPPGPDEACCPRAPQRSASPSLGGVITAVDVDA